MVVFWMFASLATAGDCAELEGDEKAVCERDETRADLEKQIRKLGRCKADRPAQVARCLQTRADLARQVADLYADDLPERRGAPRAEREDGNRMEADITEE